MGANTALLDVIPVHALPAAVPAGIPVGQHLQHLALDVCKWLAHLNADRASALRASLPRLEWSKLRSYIFCAVHVRCGSARKKA